MNFISIAEKAGVVISQNMYANAGTWKWRARNGFYAGPFDTKEEAAEHACVDLDLYEE